MTKEMHRTSDLVKSFSFALVFACDSARDSQCMEWNRMEEEWNGIEWKKGRTNPPPASFHDALALALALASKRRWFRKKSLLTRERKKRVKLRRRKREGKRERTGEREKRERRERGGENFSLDNLEEREAKSKGL